MLKKYLKLLCVFTMLNLAFANMGTQTIALTDLFAVWPNGSPAPKKDAACKQQYQNYLGQMFVLTYNINNATDIQTGTAEFGGYSFKLWPMGLIGKYGFISQQGQGNIIRVIAVLDSSFRYQSGLVLLKGSSNNQYSCILQSSATD